jgi:cell division protein FtsA
MKEKIIAGLDIGSQEVRLVVGQLGGLRQEDGNNLQIIGAVSVPSQGISKGVVKSIEDVTSSISACLEKAEKLVGIPIEHVWVSMNSPYIKCEKSRGVVAIGRSDGEIGHEDVERALDAARALSVPPNYEILHVIPVKFTVDNQGDIRDPVGMIGVRLEVETLIVQGLSSQIKNLTKAIFRTGLDIDDLVLSPLAAAEAVINSKQKDLGSALVNIGSSTTSMAVFEEGELLHTAVIPIGSEHISADIAIGLRCPINLAEKIKTKYGSADPSRFEKEENVDVSELAREEGASGEIAEVSLHFLAEIIQARVEEIFQKIDQELASIDRSGMLPGGVFLIGGGTKVQDIATIAKKQLRLPATLGSNKNIFTVIDKVNDTEFLNALGLVAWGSQVGDVAKKGSPGADRFGQMMEKVSGLFKSIIPKK